MRKKILAVLLGVTMVATTLIGCGSPQNNTKETEKNTSSKEETKAGESGSQSEGGEDAEVSNLSGEFTYWTFTDSANNLVAEFNKKYPDVKINLQIFGGDEYKTKILTALQSQSDVPDVFDLEEAYMYDFLDSDLLEDLSYVGIEDLTKDFYPFQLAGMKDTKGNFKSILFQSSPVGMWYLQDAAEKWLGTSDPEEITAMMPDWDSMLEVAKDVYDKSNGEVYLWPNMGEIVKIDAFSFDPLVTDGKLSISDDWVNLIDDLRKVRESGYSSELDSWSSEWAAAWNEGKLLFRVMPSWDFFTDWDANSGNVGVAAAPRASWEGGTGTCVYSKSENKEIAGEFIKFLASDEFQKINMEQYNQVPASKKVTDELAKGYADEKFGGQNLLATYSEICANIPGITPDKYTRAVQSLFLKASSNGIKEGKDNDAILAEFKKLVADQYPEISID